MAAERIVGRLCVCGCGQPIEQGRKNAAYTIPCRERRDSERHAERHRSKVQQTQRRTPHPRTNRVVKRVTWRDDPNRRQKLCKVCFGMPWARRPERVNEGHAYSLIPVAGDNLMCNGCGEPYSPEPPAEPGEVLTSSAGMTAKYAELHSINFNIDWDRKKHKRTSGR